MARSSSSTHSPRAALSSPSERSRVQRPSPPSSATDRAQAAPQPRGPSEKKHKNLQEVQASGRQSDQGGRPGARKTAASRRSR